MGSIAIMHVTDGVPDPTVARKMVEAAPHRGTEVTHDVSGRTLLAVGTAPERATAWLARQGTRVAAYVGTLDNHTELWQSLHAGTAPRCPENVAETILALTDRWGLGAVARLRGSFAGAITDGSAVHLFRDHFGFRPLFFHPREGGIVAASEVKQVLAGSNLQPRADVDHLLHVLFGGVSDTTAFQGVRRVPRATILTVRDGDPVGHRYWRPEEDVETRRIGFAESREGVVELLDQAVRRTLTGHDAILLSGGLDSPSVAASAVRATPPPGGVGVRAVTGVYPDHPSVDEQEWTRLVADHVGIPLHTYEPRAGALDDLDSWLRLVDGPVDTLSLPECAQAYRACRAVGARTVLTGELAENVFHTQPFTLDHLIARGRFRPAGEMLRHRVAMGQPWRDITRDVTRAILPTPLRNAYYRRTPPRLRSVPSWVDRQHVLAGGQDWRRPPSRERWRVLQTASFRGAGIGFEATEICATACGVDVRLPFADVDLWQFVLTLPAEVKTPPGARPKPLLRDAMRGRLPDAILDRRDKTFFDEFQLDRADYDQLRRRLTTSDMEFDGIDYATLRERLAQADMAVSELYWARDLARLHAFVEQVGT